MTWRTLLFGLMIAAVPLGASAQDRPADQYFHEAAQQYIGEQIEQAKKTVQAGLEAHPSDARLQTLLEKLEQERESQSGGGDQSEAQNQQNENRPNDGSDASDGNEQNRSEEQRAQPDPSADDAPQGAPNDRDAASGEAGSPDEPRSDARQGGSDEARPNQLSRLQAERILRALANQERQLLREIQRHGEADRRVEKDW